MYNPNKTIREALILIDIPVGTPVKIDAPPCSGCRHWNPQVINEEGHVICCDSKEMTQGFSCFAEKVKI